MISNKEKSIAQKVVAKKWNLACYAPVIALDYGGKSESSAAYRPCCLHAEVLRIGKPGGSEHAAALACGRA